MQRETGGGLLPFERVRLAENSHGAPGVASEAIHQLLNLPPRVPLPP